MNISIMPWKVPRETTGRQSEETLAGLSEPGRQRDGQAL